MSIDELINTLEIELNSTQLLMDRLLATNDPQMVKWAEIREKVRHQLSDLRAQKMVETFHRN